MSAERDCLSMLDKGLRIPCVFPSLGTQERLCGYVIPPHPLWWLLLRVDSKFIRHSLFNVPASSQKSHPGIVSQTIAAKCLRATVCVCICARTHTSIHIIYIYMHVDLRT